MATRRPKSIASSLYWLAASLFCSELRKERLSSYLRHSLPLRNLKTLTCRSDPITANSFPLADTASEVANAPAASSSYKPVSD